MKKNISTITVQAKIFTNTTTLNEPAKTGQTMMINNKIIPVKVDVWVGDFFNQICVDENIVEYDDPVDRLVGIGIPERFAQILN